jgi:uncharacterized lipoprotein YehR (DUF1307 family)
MKKITKLIALVLALALVLSLTACAGKASIVGTWKYTLDFKKLMEASGELSTEGGEDNQEMVDAMVKLFDGLTMVLVLDLKEDKSFTMSTDEASLKAANELIKERLPEFLKTMFGGEENLNAMLGEGQTLDDLVNSYSEEFNADDMKLEETKGTYTYEEGKLVLTPEDGEATTMTVELSAKELKVTALDSKDADDDMAEALKSVLPMVFTK